MFTIDRSEIRAALRARERAAALHLYDARVSLIDVGFRIKESENKRVTEELAVRVHVRYKPRGLELEAFSTRHPERMIDEDRIGFPIDLITADYRLQGNGFFAPPVDMRARFFDPLHGGISISNEWDYNYGTCGGWVKDRDTGADMILSAWHVMGALSYARSGLKILQPGFGDGGTLIQSVAKLARHGMNEGIDAAVAELSGRRTLVNDQLDLGPVTGVASPSLGMNVVKSGRTSRITHGIVDGIEGEQTIRYRGFPRIIRHIAHITHARAGDEVSSPGDSGAWWLEKKSMKAVGLHFAGDNQPEYALAIDMPEVLNALNVAIVV